MTARVGDTLTQFHWTPQPKAEILVQDLIGDFLSRCDFAALLRDRMDEDAGVRFHDIVDHISLPTTTDLERQLVAAGFDSFKNDAFGDAVYIQDQGIFPRIVAKRGPSPTKVVLKVEAVADFEAVWQTDAEVIGPPLAPIRWARVWSESDHELWVVERHGNDGFALHATSPPPTKTLFHADQFRCRPRTLDEVHGFNTAEHLIDLAINDLGADYVCDMFFAIEREYWQRRNRAGQFQKARQDRLGLGWANHDHHTYRSSRTYFARLIFVFEKLGFHCRERFYAGREAGWGAQVLEQPRAGIVIFADVDLSPDELCTDFAHAPLAEQQELGTVGLWCGLHGESFLAAGMHHLECQFDFDGLASQLKTEAGINVMKPFTDFPYLRQAFTEGERWQVWPERIAKLMQAGKITADQATAFESEGAIGSHLENLERNAGFKGFNQTGVSEIITATDPRKHLDHAST